MICRVWGSLALLVLSGNIAFGDTLQDRKLPSPAVFEAVFPHLVFGKLESYSRFETALVLANPENRTAQVEVHVRYSDGQPAATFFHGSKVLPAEGLLPDIGVFCLELAPHAVTELAFPGNDPRLLEKEFDGWVALRANGRIFAHQVLRVIDSRNTRSEVGAAAGYSAASRAEIAVSNVAWEPVGEGSGQWWGWNYLQTGITVVNPFPTSASVALTLKGTKRGFELPPLTKRSFLISELFPTFRGGFSYDMDSSLLVEAQTETPFVILGLNTFIDTDPNGRPDPKPDRPWLTFSLPRTLNIPGGVPFSFRDEIITEALLAGRQILVTRLGLVVSSPGEPSPQVFPIDFGVTRNQYLGVVSDETLGLAVVYGASDIPIIFAKTGHVLRIPENSYSRPTVSGTETPNQVAVTFQRTCAYQTYIIDVQAEKVVSTKYTPAYCPL